MRTIQQQLWESVVLSIAEATKHDMRRKSLDDACGGEWAGMGVQLGRPARMASRWHGGRDWRVWHTEASVDRNVDERERGNG